MFARVNLQNIRRTIFTEMFCITILWGQKRRFRLYVECLYYSIDAGFGGIGVGGQSKPCPYKFRVITNLCLIVVVDLFFIDRIVINAQWLDLIDIAFGAIEFRHIAIVVNPAQKLIQRVRKTPDICG